MSHLSECNSCLQSWVQEQLLVILADPRVRLLNEAGELEHYTAAFNKEETNKMINRSKRIHNLCNELV
jgi:hypothetical protein